MSDWPGMVAIVGAGTMGAGFARVLSGAGTAFKVFDVNVDAARSAATETSYSRAPNIESDPLGVATTSLEEAVRCADLILEATTENPKVKASVLKRVEKAASDASVIASNTSAIPILSLAKGLKHPDRFAGVHWFNPPDLVPGVEIIPSDFTAKTVVEKLRGWLLSLGKRPSVVGDTPGFVGNRIQFAMFREAAAIVDEGIADAATVDEVVSSTFGFRLPFMGPFAIADLAGLDVYEGAYAAMQQGYGERLSAPRSLLELVADGKLGAKTGSGYLSASELRGVHPEQRRDGFLQLSQLLGRLRAKRQGAQDQ